MVVFKVTPVFLLVLVVGAEKKIELQDIEEDNLKSEKQTEYEHADPRSQSSGQGSGHTTPSLDFLKSGFLRYFENPQVTPPQPTRFIQQYAVTEAPERPPEVAPKVQYSHSGPQQAMVGYLSNVPMQIYLVPQYYNEVDQGGHAPTGTQYTGGNQYSTASHHPHGVARVANYPTAPESVQQQTNYIEVPTYVPPTAKTYIPQYSSAPVTYVSYTPQASPAPTVTPVVTYQVPVVQYSAPVVAPQPAPKNYYQKTQYQNTNAVEVEPDSVDDSPKQYTYTDVSYSKAPSDFPRFYSSRPPSQDEYNRYNHVHELPHPNPLLLKGLPPHLAHIPKALPMLRPLNKPVYGSHPPPGILAGRPSEHYRPIKRRPTSLLDSYIPSSLQIEYMKRGFTNDPLQAYEDLSNGHHLSHSLAPKHYKRGFVPNQLYPTARGGVTFGHFNREPKVDKFSHN